MYFGVLEDELNQPHRYQRSRPRARHSQDPSYRAMSPVQSPYGPEERDLPPRQNPRPERPQANRRFEHQQSVEQVQQVPSLPPHMQSYSNGEYGSDGSETMSVNSAQSMQNRQIRQQLPQSSEDGECSSNSLRHQNYVNDEYGQNQSMEEANQSDSASKSNAQALKEMKERKKSLMTRFIPGRGPGGAGEKRTGFARSEEVGVPESLLNPTAGGISGPSMFQKQASKESTDSDK